MPRTARAIASGFCYHLINRANMKARLFHEAADYEQFLALIARAQARLHVPMLAACLMPNHIHLVVRPTDGEDLARWTHWLFTTHVRWHHEKYDATGRVWQGRFKAFASETDHHPAHRYALCRGGRSARMTGWIGRSGNSASRRRSGESVAPRARIAIPAELRSFGGAVSTDSALSPYAANQECPH
jgi:REP element-mobilizing transposase RayT